MILVTHLIGILPVSAGGLEIRRITVDDGGWGIESPDNRNGIIVLNQRVPQPIPNQSQFRIDDCGHGPSLIVKNLGEGPRRIFAGGFGGERGSGDIEKPRGAFEVWQA